MKDKIQQYISSWEDKCYHNGIPDEAPIPLERQNKVPSYRQLCTAILKNDRTLKSIGFTPKKHPVYGILKKIELTERGVIRWDGQLKLAL